MVVSETNGTWGKAQKVPGLAALGTGNSQIGSVSCASPGNCTAGGYIVRPPGTGLKAFVVVQRKGTWGKALQIRGVSEIDSLSCATAGNCVAVGFYAGSPTAPGIHRQPDHDPGAISRADGRTKAAQPAKRSGRARDRPPQGMRFLPPRRRGPGDMRGLVVEPVNSSGVMLPAVTVRAGRAVCRAPGVG